MSWEDQGRQYHMWFGHGTAADKGKKAAPGSSVVGQSTADRVLALAYGALASLPAARRAQAEAQYNNGILPRLKEAMTAWLRATALNGADFASRFFGRSAGDPVVRDLHSATLRAATATTHDDLREASGKLAQAMEAVGIDRWPGFVADAQERARDPATQAAIRDVGGTTVRLGTVTLSHTSRLGDLSMRYETGYSPGHEEKAAGVVSSGTGDPGGVSYGAYQFASSKAGGQQVQAFLKSPEGARWADRFKGMNPTQPNGAFAQKWKNTAGNEPNEFFQAQHEYIKRTHYDPVVQKVQHATSLDINQRSRALQNVIWSMSVQHGRAASLVTRAVQQAGPQGNLSNAAYDRKLINQLYTIRNAYVDAQGRPDLRTRYAAEQHDALRDLEGKKS